jgi:hypothetical protein
VGDVPKKMSKKAAMVCSKGLMRYRLGGLAGILVGSQRQSSAGEVGSHLSIQEPTSRHAFCGTREVLFTVVA